MTPAPVQAEKETVEPAEIQTEQPLEPEVEVNTTMLVHRWLSASEEEREADMRAVQAENPELFAEAKAHFEAVRAASRPSVSEGAEGATIPASVELGGSPKLLGGVDWGGVDWGGVGGFTSFGTGAIAQGLRSRPVVDDFAEQGEPDTDELRCRPGFWRVEKGGVVRRFYFGTTSKSEAQAIAQAQLGDVNVL